MIFLTVGSQKFQFDRLIKKIDGLIENGIITDTIFAQIGYSNYKPQHMEYVAFLNSTNFYQHLNESDIVITHGGTGVIVNAIKKGKKVIAIPRLKEYGEHVDNHQIELIKQFEELNLIEPVYDLNKIEIAFDKVKNTTYDQYVSNTESIISSIVDFIESN